MGTMPLPSINSCEYGYSSEPKEPKAEINKQIKC
jgi:hypothetical protein